MKRILLSICLVLLAAVSASAEIVTQEIRYNAGEDQLIGFLAYDDGVQEKRPGILVVHEWWGQNEYVRKRAVMLAELGFTALAVDMYGDGKVALHPDDAKKFSSEVGSNLPLARERFTAGLKVLQEHTTVQADKIAAIGYCFGGSTVLNMARAGVDMRGVVTFHGNLATDAPAQKDTMKAKVLVCHGGDDNFITPEQIEAFKTEMTNTGVDYTFKTYAGARHSFTNPQADTYAAQFDLPIAYNEQADHQSWSDMREFFKNIFADKGQDQ
ncbi:MAG TPA: dienelactone hydrolase [Candidatus Omnitrophica bacterium]|nr:MAG: dienelactone hydrolase [Omnitrophica WOR_2 bacterium GWA2_45_18]HBR14994.1 dienelactone hydrolase [Candidatus Omnitrophota bacterium]